MGNYSNEGEIVSKEFNPDDYTFAMFEPHREEIRKLKNKIAELESAFSEHKAVAQVKRYQDVDGDYQYGICVLKNSKLKHGDLLYLANKI